MFEKRQQIKANANAEVSSILATSPKRYKFQGFGSFWPSCGASKRARRHGNHCIRNVSCKSAIFNVSSDFGAPERFAFGLMGFQCFCSFWHWWAAPKPSNFQFFDKKIKHFGTVENSSCWTLADHLVLMTHFAFKIPLRIKFLARKHQNAWKTWAI